MRVRHGAGARMALIGARALRPRASAGSGRAGARGCGQQGVGWLFRARASRF